MPVFGGWEEKRIPNVTEKRPLLAGIQFHCFLGVWVRGSVADWYPAAIYMFLGRFGVKDDWGYVEARGDSWEGTK